MTARKRKREASPSTKAAYKLSWQTWSESVDGDWEKTDPKMDNETFWLPARHRGRVIGYVKTHDKPADKDVWLAKLYDKPWKTNIGRYKMYWPGPDKAHDSREEKMLNMFRRFHWPGKKPRLSWALPKGRLGLPTPALHNGDLIGYVKEDDKPGNSDVWWAPLYDKVNLERIGWYHMYLPGPDEPFVETEEAKLNRRRRFFRLGEEPRALRALSDGSLGLP